MHALICDSALRPLSGYGDLGFFELASKCDQSGNHHRTQNDTVMNNMKYGTVFLTRRGGPINTQVVM